MDPDIKELLRRNIAIAEDTNRTVHKLRRAAAWGQFWRIAWWLIIFAVSAAAYYLYLQPYVQKIESLYGQVQQTGTQAQSFGQKVSNFFGSWVPSTSTTTTN